MGIISGSGSFRGRFGDHFRVGDHFGVGIISGAVQTPSLGQPPLLQAAITSTPGSALGSGIPTLEQLREKKKPGSTLPNNFVFSSKGTISYESLDLPDFVNGFLEFQKQQADACKPGLTKHLQLLMARIYLQLV